MPGTRILHREEIERLVDLPDLIAAIEAGFRAYSAGEVVVAPVGHLSIPDFNADVHIKYGYTRGGEQYVVKIASGHPQNARLGLPTGTGLMLVFRLRTGELDAVLLDEAYLTDLRTAVGGAVAARALAPAKVERIGIVGTGVQARAQLRLLASVTHCRMVLVASVNPSSTNTQHAAALAAYRHEMEPLGFDIETTVEVHQVPRSCNLIVTATSSRAPLIGADDVRPGTHVTAVGADAPGKQELDPALVARADVVVADSRIQCVDHGDLAHAVRLGMLDSARIVELGDVLAERATGRTREDQVTVCDLTGVAVQDIIVAQHVVRRAGDASAPLAAKA